MNRRRFIGSVLALFVAPRLPNLPTLRPESEIVLPYVSFRVQDFVFTIDDFTERMIRPAMMALADQIDRDFLNALT